MLPESRTVDEFWASSTGAFRDEGVAGLVHGRPSPPHGHHDVWPSNGLDMLS